MEFVNGFDVGKHLRQHLSGEHVGQTIFLIHPKMKYLQIKNICIFEQCCALCTIQITAQATVFMHPHDHEKRED